MSANSFKELEKQNEQQFRGQDVDRKIERNVNHSFKLFRFIGNIFDLYIPRVFSIITGTGASQLSNNGQDNIAEHASDSDQPKYPNNTNKK